MVWIAKEKTTTTQRAKGKTTSNSEEVTNQGDDPAITVCNDSHTFDGR